MWCVACGYDLRGLRGGRCPECGRGFDPKDPATFRRSRRRVPRGVRVAGGALARGVGLALASFAVTIAIVAGLAALADIERSPIPVRLHDDAYHAILIIWPISAALLVILYVAAMSATRRFPPRKNPRKRPRK